MRADDACDAAWTPSAVVVGEGDASARPVVVKEWGIRPGWFREISEEGVQIRRGGFIGAAYLRRAVASLSFGILLGGPRAIVLALPGAFKHCPLRRVSLRGIV